MTKKLGSSTGKFDKNGDLVCVGDVVKSLSGKLYVVDRYGKYKPQEIANAKGMNLQDFEIEIVRKWDEEGPVDAQIPEVEVTTMVPAEEIEKVEEATEGMLEKVEEAMTEAKEELKKEVEEKFDDVNESCDNIDTNVLQSFSDEELAEELRRRGFTLTASKEIVTVTVKNL